MPEYTLLTVVSIVAVVGVELLWLRTGIFRTARYWLTMIIVWAFQIPVDGWLTKLSDPIVIYRESQTLGLRFPWDIPIEDFGFGFSMVTLAIMVWDRVGRRPGSADPQLRSPAHPARTEARTEDRTEEVSR
jgi:lycopene cyclase domain-containing protein